MQKLFRSHSTPALPEGSDPSALIELRDVVKSFHNAAGEFIVLRGISASFNGGEFASIVGRSGSGKSTLLNMITGIDHPTSGFVRVGETILHKLDEGQLSVWRGRNMGIVFQFFQLLPMLTLLENVMLPMDFCNLYTSPERETRARNLLGQVGLEGLEHKYPAAVSGGQQQTAAVARALATDPPILVADEPTGNLDSKTAEMVLSIFEDQAAQGKTVLMVTHDITLARKAQRILVISDGELIPEALSAALPMLSHDLLLQLSRGARPVSYSPGDPLPTNGSAALLLVITGGKVIVETPGVLGKRSMTELGPGSLISPAGPMARLRTRYHAGTAVNALAIDVLPDSIELREILAQPKVQKQRSSQS
jgi:putative ABC transport system ATP-binding protein